MEAGCRHWESKSSRCKRPCSFIHWIMRKIDKNDSILWVVLSMNGVWYENKVQIGWTGETKNRDSEVVSSCFRRQYEKKQQEATGMGFWMIDSGKRRTQASTKYSSRSLFSGLLTLGFTHHKCIKLLFSFVCGLVFCLSCLFTSLSMPRNELSDSLDSSHHPPAQPPPCYRFLSCSIKRLTFSFFQLNPLGKGFLCSACDTVHASAYHRVMESITNLLFHHWIPRNCWLDSSRAPQSIKKFCILLIEST